MNIQFVRKSATNNQFKEVFEKMTCQDIIKELKCFDEVPLNVSTCKENLGILIYMYNKVNSFKLVCFPS
jgi:hypothetical protein